MESRLSSEGRKAFHHMTSDVDGTDGKSVADREYEEALKAARMANPAQQKKEKKGWLSRGKNKKDGKPKQSSQRFSEINRSSGFSANSSATREGDDTDADLLAAEEAAREAARMIGDKKVGDNKSRFSAVSGVLSRKKKAKEQPQFPRAGEIAMSGVKIHAPQN